MYATAKAGLAHARPYSLDAYLSGDREAPAAGSPVALPLLRLCQARVGQVALHPQSPDAAADFRGDETLAWGWWSAHRIATDATRDRRRPDAEYTARGQMHSLWEHLRERSNRRDFVYMAEAFDDASFASVAEDYALLLGVLALCLAECGVEEARVAVRERAAELALEDFGRPYSRAVLGLAGGQSVLQWLPEQGALGVLAASLDWGGRCLEAALPEARSDRDRAEAEARAKRTGPRLRDIVETPEEAAPTPVDDGPSLMVLASVSHLPGAAEDGAGKPGKATSSTARGEWAPYAGLRWPLARVPDLAAARAELHGEFPYAEELIDAVLGDLVGRPHVYVRPVLLVGGPGSGKTRLARRIGEVLGLGVQVYGCAGQADGAWVGTSRQWSTGRASVPLQTLKRLGAASAMIVLDEIEKASARRDNGSLLDGLLPFLTDDARRIVDPYVEIDVNLSAVSYVATANDLAGLRRSHPALVDRFRVYAMPAPRAEDLPVVARTILADLRIERGLGEDWLPDLDGEELALVADHYDGGSLRLVRRIVETVVAGRDALAARH